MTQSFIYAYASPHCWFQNLRNSSIFCFLQLPSWLTILSVLVQLLVLPQSAYGWHRNIAWSHSKIETMYRLRNKTSKACCLQPCLTCMFTVPLCFTISPNSEHSKELFPDPTGPTTATSWPLPIWMLTLVQEQYKKEMLRKLTTWQMYSQGQDVAKFNNSLSCNVLHVSI